MLLTVAAFAIPVFTQKNVYCQQLCPHGEAQQLLARIGRRPTLPHVRLPRRAVRALRIVPALLLVLVVAVAQHGGPVSLVDIEPFDAYVFWIAGWATITIALVGLTASLFVPMAYCRFGCPTGALIEYVRYRPAALRSTRGDWVALACVCIAVAVSVW